MTGCCDDGTSQLPEVKGQRVGDASAVHEGGRLHVKVQGRYITILRQDGQLFALDSSCYHSGGPLGLGDIEGFDGSTCLVCPWHKYKVDIRTGEELYQAMQYTNGKMVPGKWTRRAQQRSHKVHEHGGGIYVVLSRQLQLSSDKYAHDPQYGERVLRQPARDCNHQCN